MNPNLCKPFWYLFKIAIFLNIVMQHLRSQGKPYEPYLGNIFNWQNWPDWIWVACKSNFTIRRVSVTLKFHHTPTINTAWISFWNHAFPERIWSPGRVIFTCSCQEKIWMNYRVKIVNFGKKLTEINHWKSELKNRRGESSWSWDKIDNSENLVYF